MNEKEEREKKGNRRKEEKERRKEGGGGIGNLRHHKTIFTLLYASQSRSLDQQAVRLNVSYR